jgi:hypothetical protein
MADSTLTMPNKSAAPPAASEPAAERRVPVKLLSDVWISEPGHADATPDGIRRIRTNIPVKDDLGNIKVDPKSKSIISTQSIVDLPVSIAKAMIDQGKAERMDPL